MDGSKRLGVGEGVAAGSAILLLVFTFFRWYGLGGQVTDVFGWFAPFEYGGNAWQTLDYLPLILLLAITVPVGVALLRLSGLGWWSPTPPGALTCGGGVLAALAILARIVFPPELVDDFGTVLESGIFLALAAACGIAAGGLLVMREEVGSFAGLLVAEGGAGEEEEPADEDEAGEHH